MFLLRTMRRSLNFLIPNTPLGDRIYATMDLSCRYRRFPRYHKPVDFNDHVLRLRVGPESDSELRRLVADKIEVKKYVSRVVGGRYTLAPLAVLETDRDVDHFKPPVPSVVKPSHMSGQVLIIRQGEPGLDRKKVKKWLRTDYYRQHRERVYKDMPKRVLVEELLSEDGVTLATDFKVYCFAGIPKLIQMVEVRNTGTMKTHYTADWKWLPLYRDCPAANPIPRPVFLTELLDVSARLAEPFSFIRVDSLAANNIFKINEMTNVPNAAREGFKPVGADQKLGPLFTCPDADAFELLNS